MNWLSIAVRRIGSRDAVSWPVFWITLAAGVIGNVITNSTAPIDVRVVAISVGQLALWLPLSIVGIVLHRQPDRHRPALVLTAALGGLMIRALVIGLVFSISLGANEVKWTSRFAGALLNVGLSFVMSTYIVSSIRERRRQITELKGVEQHLLAVVAAVTAEFAQRNEQAVENAQAILLHELNALDPTDARASLDVLQHTAQEVVRPLSHALAKTRPPEDDEALPVIDAHVSWRDVLDGAAIGAPFNPGITALFMGVELLAATVAYPAGMWVFAFLIPVMWGLVAFANVILRVVLPGRHRSMRMALVVIAALAVGCVMAALVRVGVSRAPMVDGLTFGAFFFAVVFTLGVGVAASFARDRNRIVTELHESSRALQRRIVQWRQAQWFQQKSLSRALHGPIQTAVSAAALHLDASIQSGVVSPETIEQVRSQLLGTVRQLAFTDTAVASLAEAIDLITCTWDGLCDVSTQIADDVDEVLTDSTALRSCILDIVTEAVSNAVRHGRASRVSIAIHFTDEHHQDLQVFIESDSTRRGERGNRGLGTLLLEECALEWQLDETDQGMQLSALLPVAS